MNNDSSYAIAFSRMTAFKRSTDNCHTPDATRLTPVGSDDGRSVVTDSGRHALLDVARQRWLNGNEYWSLLNMFAGSSERYRLSLFEDGNHPQQIYFAPVSGMIYGLLAENSNKVGFPRLIVGEKKDFIWKRMNFVTCLPKKDPKVCYIVASASSKKTNLHYKMHIVWSASEDIHIAGKQVILCHILKSEQYLSHLDMNIMNHENIRQDLPSDREELDAYLMQLGEQIMRRKSEPSSEDGDRRDNVSTIERGMGNVRGKNSDSQDGEEHSDKFVTPEKKFQPMSCFGGFRASHFDQSKHITPLVLFSTPRALFKEMSLSYPNKNKFPKNALKDAFMKPPPLKLVQTPRPLVEPLAPVKIIITPEMVYGSLIEKACIKTSKPKVSSPAKLTADPRPSPVKMIDDRNTYWTEKPHMHATVKTNRSRPTGIDFIDCVDRNMVKQKSFSREDRYRVWIESQLDKMKFKKTFDFSN